MNTEDFKKVFKLPFAEAEQFFRDKLTLESSAWDDLSGAAHAKAFTSAGAYQAELLAELRAMTDKAIAGGMDIKEFRQQFRSLVDRYGWQLKGGGTAWRSDLIWRTNVTTAYQAGRWQQFEAGGIKYLMYVHKDGLMHPRPTHVAMDGTVLPIDDPFWTANYPPNGFRCHCRAVAATEQEYQGAPVDKGTRPRGWENMADNGWRYNVGQAGAEKGYRALTDKFESLPNDIASAWMQRFVQEPAFERFIAGKIEGDFPVAVLSPEARAAIGAETQTAWISADSLAKNKGEQPQRSKGHPELTVDEYRLLPKVIGNPLVVIEKKGIKEVFAALGDRYYLAVVKVTKDKKGLFVQSFRMSSLSDIRREMGNGRVLVDKL